MAADAAPTEPRRPSRPNRDDREKQTLPRPSPSWTAKFHLPGLSCIAGLLESRRGLCGASSPSSANSPARPNASKPANVDGSGTDCSPPGRPMGRQNRRVAIVDLVSPLKSPSSQPTPLAIQWAPRIEASVASTTAVAVGVAGDIGGRRRADHGELLVRRVIAEPHLPWSRIEQVVDVLDFDGRDARKHRGTVVVGDRQDAVVVPVGYCCSASS